MPFGAFLESWPTPLFLLVHLVVFVLAALFAHRAFGAENETLGWGFTLAAMAQLFYVAADLEIAVLLLANGIAELIEIAALGFLAAGSGLTLFARRGRGV